MNIEKIKDQSEKIIYMENALIETEAISKSLNSVKDDYWNCFMAQHRDGNGWKINLNGTYVTRDLLLFLIKNLITKIKFEKENLKKLIE